MGCNQCGMCCKAIRIEFSPEYIEKKYEEYYPGVKDPYELSSWNDFAFVKACWNPITKEEALKRNPHIKTWTKEDLDGYFYECIQLENNKCSYHEGRPAVCRYYPFYGTELGDDFRFYSPNCGYIKDVKKGGV